MNDSQDNRSKNPWGQSLRYGAVGLEMGVSILIGYGAGWWLDEKFGTKPTLTLVMMLLGIGAAFNAVYRVAKEVQRDADKEEAEENPEDNNT
jgi:ATP synthase protein I